MNDYGDSDDFLSLSPFGMPMSAFEFFYLINSQSNPAHFKFGISISNKSLKTRIKERARQCGVTRLAGYKACCFDPRAMVIEKEFRELCEHIEKSIKKPFLISREVIDLNVLDNKELESVVIALKETGVTCPNLVRINEDARDYWLNGYCLYSDIKPITADDL